MKGLGALLVKPEDCARQIYEQAPFEFEPGTTFAYNSFHLQVAGAMAATAAKTTVQGLLHKNLIDKLGMRSTHWLAGQNPLLAGAMITTGNDYDRFLRAYLSYDLIPKPFADEMEKDYLARPYATHVANGSSADLIRVLGHYSLANYFECLNVSLSGRLLPTNFTSECLAAGVHMDAGLFGWYPIIDRSNGTYMQIAQSTLVKSINDFKPTTASVKLRVLIKPLVDRALSLSRNDSEVWDGGIMGDSEGSHAGRDNPELGFERDTDLGVSVGEDVEFEDAALATPAAVSALGLYDIAPEVWQSLSAHPRGGAKGSDYGEPVAFD